MLERLLEQYMDNRLVPSRYLSVFGVREDWGLGWDPARAWACAFNARLNLIPNLLSPQKHLNSDWVRVWDHNVYSIHLILLAILGNKIHKYIYLEKPV